MLLSCIIIIIDTVQLQLIIYTTIMCCFRKFAWGNLLYMNMCSIKSTNIQYSYHCSFTENLAFGKLTFQSGTTYNDGKSSKAVDGNSDTHFRYGSAVGSCTYTLRSNNNPWWRVNLQQVQYVSEVYIVNRGSECGCPDRFKNFEIRVGMLFTIEGFRATCKEVWFFGPIFIFLQDQANFCRLTCFVP